MAENTTDNISILSADDGKQFKIDKRDMKVIFKPCKGNKHNMVIDETEVSDYWQGYICQSCGIGKLIRK